VDIPKTIHLEWEFVASLRDRTLSEKRIPPARLGDWSNAEKMLDEISSHAVAHLLWNYRKMRNQKRSCICIEVKPKAGYTAFSPLVNPQNRVKYSSTRFQILQQLHCNGTISKGWSTHQLLPEQSLYNPLDLFSNDADRVQRALRYLVNTPQNNMRVWVDDEPLLGTDGNQTTTNDLHEKALNVLFSPEGRSGDPQASFFETLTSFMTQILLREEMLAKVLRLQRLDVVDADGAIVIYERLREISEKDADALLDSPTSLEERTEAKEDDILVSSPFRKPRACPDLDTLLDQINCFSRQLKSLPTGQPQPSSHIMDKAHERSKSCVKSLSRDASVYLLKNWLLSLVMCDVSFFLVLHPVASFNDAKELGVIVDNECEDGKVSVRCQTETSPGLMVLPCDNDQQKFSGNAAFVYTLKVIDCDMKPASKLRNREAKEEPIRFYKKVKPTEEI
jgi:inositol-pentakisphosphate 2-kinase